MSMKDIIDYSADRGIYICQSQSLNLWMKILYMITNIYAHMQRVLKWYLLS